MSLDCRMEECPNWNGHGCVRGVLDSCVGSPMTADSPDLDRLDALARAATDGPWLADVRSDGRAWIDLPGVDGHGLSLHGFAADAEFIAATDPPTVLALIAELRQARAQLTAVQRIVDHPPFCGEVHVDVIRDALALNHQSSDPR